MVELIDAVGKCLFPVVEIHHNIHMKSLLKMKFIEEINEQLINYIIEGNISDVE